MVTVLAFKFTFGCSELDNKNWAVDFGGLKDPKDWLEDQFDHKIRVDVNDPTSRSFTNYRIRTCVKYASPMVWAQKSLQSMHGDLLTNSYAT